MELTVEKITQEYHGAKALDEVSFTLGEGILRPAAGRVLWNGEDIARMDWRYREIAASVRSSHHTVKAVLDTGRRERNYMVAGK